MCDVCVVLIEYHIFCMPCVSNNYHWSVKATSLQDLYDRLDTLIRK